MQMIPGWHGILNPFRQNWDMKEPQILIKRRALESALAGAKAAYPNEFACILIGKVEEGKAIIEEIAIPPGISVSGTSSSFNEWMLPLIDGQIGIFHSHPSDSNKPSSQDMSLFSQKGGINLIASAPYEITDVACYLASGKKMRFTVID
jgi:proteasome lid subunit RPN8/RPN11